MTQRRVVAGAATCILLLSIDHAMAAPAIDPTRLDGFDTSLTPSLGALANPAAGVSTWPDFVDPYRLDARNRLALASPRRGTPRARSGPAARALPSQVRRNLLERVSSVLPRYNHMFRQAAHRYDLPASLLAAQAYMESKWRPGARYRGAAGMMMLSSRTARLVDVQNRMSPAQSVRGGARYLERIRARVPASVPYPDRNLFALAAYNMGTAHLQDARLLARRLGKNPDLWSGVRQVLPLMAERRYYRNLPYGYVRGAHVVHYVERVKRFQSIISPHID